MAGRQTADQGDWSTSSRLWTGPEGQPLRKINAVFPVFAGLQQAVGAVTQLDRPRALDRSDHQLRIDRWLLPWPRLRVAAVRGGGAQSAYRWFCRPDLNDAVPGYSSFSTNRHGRFRERDLPAGFRGGNARLHRGDTGQARRFPQTPASSHRRCRGYARLGLWRGALHAQDADVHRRPKHSWGLNRGLHQIASNYRYKPMA
jgi:hypothetical protein